MCKDKCCTNSSIREQQTSWVNLKRSSAVASVVAMSLKIGGTRGRSSRYSIFAFKAEGRTPDVA